MSFRSVVDPAANLLLRGIAELIKCGVVGAQAMHPVYWLATSVAATQSKAEACLGPEIVFQLEPISHASLDPVIV